VVDLALEKANHCRPIREFSCSEMYMDSLEAVSPIFGTIVNQIMPVIQVLVVRQYESFVGSVA
jgi:hypothetical protein